MKRIAAFLVAAALLTAACGAEGTLPASSSTTAASTTSPGSTGLPACGYYDIEGCALFGLVLPEPQTTAAVLEAVAGLPGVAVALWRTDLACVLAVTMLPPGSPGYGARTASRFAYVDAEGIRERRLATSGSVAPPITGMHISESYWDHWEDQWAQAQREGVLVEAVAVYLPEALLADGPPAGFRALVPVPWRRTDSLDPSYSGELLLQSEDFPAGYLSEPSPLPCE